MSRHGVANLPLDFSKIFWQRFFAPFPLLFLLRISPDFFARALVFFPKISTITSSPLSPPERDETLMVGIAQLVESRIVIPVVVGSSPISHPTDF